MNNFIDVLYNSFQLDFVRNAMLVAIFISLASALLGIPLVLKQYSFIGDGLSHVAFGAIAVSFALKFTNNMWLTLLITIIAAIILLNNKKSKDSTLAIISVSSLAFGYITMNLFSSSTNISSDVCTTLFGSTSILTLHTAEVILSIVLLILVILFYIIFYTKIFSITFDESFSKSIGINVDLFNTIFSIIVAIVIVLSMNLVGSLLITALLVFPVLSSSSLFKNFKMVVIASCIYQIICVVIGLLISIVYGTPVGSTIVIIELIVYLICQILKKFIY